MARKGIQILDLAEAIELRLVRDANMPMRVPHVDLDEDHPDFEHARAKQEFKDECNINTFIANWKKGIQPPEWMRSSTPFYGDFSSLPSSLDQAYELVSRAEEAFASLPAEFRRELGNDPTKLDSAPRELWERFGLLARKSDGAAPSGSAAASPGAIGGPGGSTPSAASGGNTDSPGVGAGGGGSSPPAKA